MKKIEIPVNCPVCGYTLERVNDQLFCKNTACEAQINGKLQHFAKVLGIKGLGPKAVEKLALSDLTELFYLDVDTIADALNSQKTAEKLIVEIDKARNADLATVLASFSIPLIGETAGNKIASVVSSIDEINEETCKLAGLGEKATANLLNWLNTEFQEIREFLPFSFKSKKGSNSGETKGTICITGKLSSYKTKAEAYSILQSLGYTIVETVTKTTKYLVDEENKGSSKRKKADEYGITIISNLLNFIKEKD